MNAWDDLQKYLNPAEKVESVIFGPWGWGRAPYKTEQEWELGFFEPDPPPIPFDKRGILMTAEQAAPLMQTWSFNGGYGSPECYAVYIWTSHRVIWVTQYDGATSLDSAPRNPIACMPDMPGGG